MGRSVRLLRVNMHMWKEQLYQAVDSEVAPHLGPTVVVIATASACQPRDPDIVVEEIWDALHPQNGITDVPIVLLRFGEEGWKELERRLVLRNHDGNVVAAVLSALIFDERLIEYCTLLV